MKTKTKLLQRYAIVRTIIVMILTIACVYTISITYEPVQNLYAQGDTTGDSTGGDNSEAQIYRPLDIGNMFNERGFMKSNGVTFDDKEIINDFNGNLMYQIPIVKGKGKGDLAYDISLNYNGNVSHQIITADSSARYWLSGQYHQYNFNAPGWILSFNGLAVQMLNFESYYFTRPDNNNSALGKDIHLLANGYHLTDMLNTTSGQVKDRITIMLGDGSTETLENEAGGYEGVYKSQSLNNYMKAIVERGEGAGSRRTMYLMKGDGLTYIYKEYNVQYRDNDGNYNAPWFKPQIFLLSYVKDRFGNIYSFDYDFGGTDKIGRPRLAHCEGLYLDYVKFWDTYYGIKLRTVDGAYKLYTDPFNIYGDSHHRPNLNKIVNPSGEVMSFGYEDYTRKGLGLYSITHGSNSHYDMTIRFGGLNSKPLSRIKKVTNFDGGVREYSYIPDNPELTADYNLSSGPGHPVTHVQESGKFFGQGRDCFFANMLSEVKVKEGGVEIRKETFSYDYNANNRTDIWTRPVDSRDEYVTTREISSLSSSNNNNTPTSRKSIKTYKNFATRDISTEEKTDFDGTIKLIDDKYYSENEQNPFRILTTTYWKGAATDNDPQKDYNGTFLDSTVTETIDGVPRTSYFSYIGGGKSLIQEKTEIDPLGRKTVTHFKDFFGTKYKVFSDGTYKVRTTQSYDDSIHFYLIQQPDTIRIFKDNTLLDKKTIEYYTDTNVTLSIVGGYPGQIRYQRTHDVISGSVLSTVSYLYTSQDTIGSYVYGGSLFIIPEGNIRQVTDPNGNITRYYYDIVSRSEEANFQPCSSGSGTDQINCPPRLTYHRIFDNGVDTIEATTWKDDRMPSRIDRFITSQRYISNYQTYDLVGNPVAMVDNNNYITNLQYEKYGRISVGTLPYDFSRSFPDTISTVTKDTVNVVITSKSTVWGRKDDLNPSYCSGDNSYTYYTSFDINNFSYGFQTNIFTSGTESSSQDEKKTAFVKLDNSKFSGITTIDSAFVEFAPISVSALSGSSSTNDFRIIVVPLKQIHSAQGCSNCGNNVTGLCVENGSGVANFSGLTFNGSPNCGGSIFDINSQHLMNKKRLNVTSLIRQNTDSVNGGGLQIEGIGFDASYIGSQTNSSFTFDMAFLNCVNTDANLWIQNASPVLHVYGKHIVVDTVKRVNNARGTMIYEYDDLNNVVTVKSKLDKSNGVSRFKKTESYFDGFGKLKQTKLFSNYGTEDSSKTYYNYLDGKAKTIDAKGNETKFSYDEFGGLSKTQNADNSVNITLDTFITSCTTSFYNITNGFVNKKVYTDETNRRFVKYFDAVGNLLREEKFVAGDGAGNPQIGDNPFDPDTTFTGQDIPGQTVTLATEYLYDDLYRVKKVKTPEGKIIEYWYDAYGRQIQRNTPDAGTTKYQYDKNGNLILSQDEKQKAAAYNLFTARTYDGLNRLLTIGDYKDGNIAPPGGTGLGDTTLPMQFDFPSSADSLYIINVYDSLAFSSFSQLFNDNKPYDFYGSKANNTKGMLIATAFRTNLTDSWSFKWYRYDARGRVLRFWQKLAGMDSVKAVDYRYNSQNQPLNLSYQRGRNDWKFFAFNYDDAARLKNAGMWLYSGIDPGVIENDSVTVPEDTEADNSGAGWSFQTYVKYTYNPNQQVDSLTLNAGISPLLYRHTYNNRNWLEKFRKAAGNTEFIYDLRYNFNGNIRQQVIGGAYTSVFGNSEAIQYTFIYDNSNRLIKADEDSANIPDKSFDLVMNYDKDGNMKALKRYGGTENVVDTFGYEYYNGTNRLKKVSIGKTEEYVYDANGNVIADSLKQNYHVKYDWRNLITELRHWRIAPGGGDSGPGSEVPPEGHAEKWVYKTNYWYDEAGNRICKKTSQWFPRENEPGLQEIGEFPEGGDGSGGFWQVQSTVYYVRDAGGKEIAIYNGNSIDQWNLYGSDQVGEIKSNGDKRFYLKDHLGTIRVVLDSTNSIIAANDYDAWGFPLENRSFISGSTDQKYQFTGKERDKESGLGNNDGYDYFGARYYDSRIANWTSIDPLFEKHYDCSPYNYVLRSPLILFDPDGMQDAAIRLTYPKQAIKEALSEINGKLKEGFVKTNTWIQNNKTITTIGKAVPYVGPILTMVEIMVSMPDIVIPVPQKATVDVGDATLITTLNSEDGGPTLNEIQGMIQKGQAPGSIKRLDKGNSDNNEKPHIHFKKDKKGENHALNKDGTWKHGGRDLTNKEKKFLEKIGWQLPK